MNLTRHEVREAEFLLLYEKMFREESISELITLHETDYEYKCDDEIETTANEVMDKLPELDEIIAKFSPKRSIDRIPKVNLAILRLAVFEILYRKGIVPQNAVVNEAVGLAKAYALEPDVKFVNGVLGSFTRSLNTNV